MQSNNAWTIERAFNWTRDYLDSKNDVQARLSTEWLLADACGLSRIEVYTQFDKPLSPDERATLRDSVRRRAAGEPLQYIVGEAGFRHLMIKVQLGVLIPRPETEVLVDLALEALPVPKEGKVLNVLDLCTGSGCIGLALAFERPDVHVTATDICPKAVALANENAQINNLTDRFAASQADLFGAESKIFDLIVSNPPYIPSEGMDTLPKEVADFEPMLALHGGRDGLDYAKQILSEAPRYLQGSSQVILELDVRNAHLAVDFAVQLNTYTSVNIVSDLTGRERFVLAKK
ncbi:MAG: peptide chain release factor N(5)-glutamine methyltransferase [Coriobacteriia bacterium]|nr:peptide chain release factor N(5)-glutamine methyltransferase [Coriobacteriia bacterium]